MGGCHAVDNLCRVTALYRAGRRVGSRPLNAAQNKRCYNTAYYQCITAGVKNCATYATFEEVREVTNGVIFEGCFAATNQQRYVPPGRLSSARTSP